MNPRNAHGQIRLSVEFGNDELLFRSHASTRVGGIVQGEPQNHGSRVSNQRTHLVSIQHKNQVGLHSQPPGWVKGWVNEITAGSDRET